MLFVLLCVVKRVFYTIHMNLIWIAFLTGLTTGGVSCLAVQGGLLASSIESKNKWASVSAFLLFKLVAYILLGFLLGALGSTFLLTPKLLGTLQILAGVFMLWSAARILDIHPIFRYGVFQPPKWVYRLLKNQTKHATLFGPAMLGFLTVLMPCGVTQATMALAVTSGSPLLGAGIMGAFVLGTSPIFFALGASIVGLLQKKAFSIVAAMVVAVFGVFTINGGVALRGSFYTLQNIWRAAVMDPAELASGATQARIEGGVQNVQINVRSNGYSASASTLKAGVPVRLSLVTQNTQGCALAFTIPEFNISKTLPVTGADTVEFTPTKPGRLAYTCGMGMYTGSFTVVL